VNVEKSRRRRAVILSADVKDDGRLLWDDEAQTLKVLTAHYDVTTTLIQHHHGRLLDSPGDNILAEFASVVDAVQGAVAIQKTLKARNAQLPENRKMEFHIGINLGEVIADSNRLYGDSVNITVRLENLAEPGGICISKTVYDQIEDKLPFGYEYLGEKTVKNASKPIAAYSVLIDTEELPHEKRREEKAEQTEKLEQMGDIFGKAHQRRKNRSKTRLYRQLRYFLILNSFLFIINIITYRGYWWIIWPVLGWGVLILWRLKRTGFTASDKNAILETQALLQASQPQTSKKDLKRHIIIQFEPKEKENSQADTVNIKVPVQVLKAGVKLSSFLPDHAKDRVAEALQTKGFDINTLLKSEEIDLFVASLSGLNVVVEKDDAKVIISCEQF
jgi:adenylate cyclase